MASDFAKIKGLSALKSAFKSLDGELGTSDRYAVGSPIEYGPFLEFGTSRMPAYPWLGPAVNETVRNGPRIAKQADSASDLVLKAALNVEANARARLQSTGARPYPQTGTLAGSVETIQLE